MGSFFFLLIGFCYLVGKLSVEKGQEKKYNQKKNSMSQIRENCEAILKDSELDKIVRNFLVGNIHDPKIKEMLQTELAYISKGDKRITDWLFRQERYWLIDLLLSKFGKLSVDTFCYRLRRLGNLEMITETVSKYEASIRVLQCIESNLRHTTSRCLLFGVCDPTLDVCREGRFGTIDGKYPSMQVGIIGTSMDDMPRAYSYVEIPFTGIQRQELTPS